jgi:hypothetical protein
MGASHDRAVASKNELEQARRILVAQVAGAVIATHAYSWNHVRVDLTEQYSPDRQYTFRLLHDMVLAHNETG